MTRHQHILFRIGELIALAEGASCLARRAARARQGTLPEKSDRRFSPEAFAAISRVCAKETAARVAGDCLKWVTGTGDTDVAALVTALRINEIFGAQAGLVADMDEIADAVYHRAHAAAGTP
jgi:alkylation response protein AidB-like acyl-CoA dehydrogenase